MTFIGNVVGRLPGKGVEEPRLHRARDAVSGMPGPGSRQSHRQAPDRSTAFV